MRVSLDWLKDFVDIKGGRDKVRHALTMTGLEVTSILDVEGDSVMDIEITPNRPDCLSILGVARELAAAQGGGLKIPGSIKKNYMNKGPGRGSAKVEILDRKSCPRYIGCIIRNIKVAPSPEWLADRLNAMGVRSVNNIVDVTNYVLFETGQPLHAFDLDTLKGKRIVIRRARKGEDILTIDGVKRALDPGILVIADAERPVAVAGIMGGKETEITPGTKKVLLESAYFDPVIIRKAQRRLSLASESSYRFERGVDFGMVLSASARAQEMIKDIGGGRVSGRITDVGGKTIKEREILLSLDEIPRVLGIDIAPEKVMECFKGLDLRPLKKAKGKILVNVPSYRRDLGREIDLIEEIARLYGYDKIPVKFPAFIIQKTYKEERKELSFLEREAKGILYSLGLNEIVSYTLTSRFAIEGMGISFDGVVRLKNPLSSNQEFLRPGLSSEMLEAVSWNLNRKNSLLRLFELNKIYLLSGDREGVEERLNLCICLCGITHGNWKEKPRKMDFFDLKGVIESFMDFVGINGYAIEKTEGAIFKDKLSGQIRVGGEIVGRLGEVKLDIARKFGIKHKVYLAEISFEGLLKYMNPAKRFKSLPRYPSLRRDISILIDDSVSALEIDNAIREKAGGLVKSIEVFDLYRGQQVQEGKKSLAYTIEYCSEGKTLKDEDVSGIHKNIQDALIKRLGAEIR